MNNDSWLRLCERRFKPLEAQKITGFSTDLQRKWIERYFKDEPHDAFYHWRLGLEDGHSRYTWAGVQALTVFGDIVSDLGIEPARAALRRGYEAMTRLNDFLRDLRDREDLFLHYDFDRPQLGFTTTTVANIKGSAGSRIYLYNVSAMQRRLVTVASEICGTAD